jgi:hypothetical protein
MDCCTNTHRIETSIMKGVQTHSKTLLSHNAAVIVVLVKRQEVVRTKTEQTSCKVLCQGVTYLAREAFARFGLMFEERNFPAEKRKRGAPGAPRRQLIAAAKERRVTRSYFLAEIVRDWARRQALPSAPTGSPSERAA